MRDYKAIYDGFVAQGMAPRSAERKVNRMKVAGGHADAQTFTEETAVSDVPAKKAKKKPSKKAEA